MLEKMFEKYVEKIPEDPVAGFTGLLVLATVLLAVIAYLQIRQGRMFSALMLPSNPLAFI
jgi:hypothetical protein